MFWMRAGSCSESLRYDNQSARQLVVVLCCYGSSWHVAGEQLQPAVELLGDDALAVGAMAVLCCCAAATRYDVGCA
jgi:hypothetical protein